MKKLILCLSIISLCSPANAQLKKGRMMIGGSFNTQNTKNASVDTSNNTNVRQSQKYSSYSASLRCGYFISDGFIIGILGAYSNLISQGKSSYLFNGVGNASTSSYKANTSNFSGGLFTRYYKMLGKSRLAFFGELVAVYGGGKTKNTYIQDGIVNTNQFPAKSQTFNAIIRPGISYFFTNTIAAEAYFGNVGYHYIKTEQGKENEPRSSSVTNSGIVSRLDFSLSNVSLGINFYFGAKNKRV